MELVSFKNNRPKLDLKNSNIKPRDSSEVTEGKWGECKWRINGDTLEIYGDNDDPNHVYQAESIIYDFSNGTTNAPWFNALSKENEVDYVNIYIYITFKENSTLYTPFFNEDAKVPLILNHAVTKLDLSNVIVSNNLFHGLVDLGTVKFTTSTFKFEIATAMFYGTIIGYLDISSFNLSNIYETYTFEENNIGGLDTFFKSAKDDTNTQIYAITTPHQFDKYGLFVNEFLKAFEGYYNVSTKEQVKTVNDVKPNTTYIGTLDDYDWYIKDNVLIINQTTIQKYQMSNGQIFITCAPWIIHKLTIIKVIIRGLIEFPEDLLESNDELHVILFSDMPECTEIEGLEYVKFNNVTDISGLFNNCPKLKSIKCNGINVAKYIGLNN